MVWHQCDVSKTVHQEGETCGLTLPVLVSCAAGFIGSHVVHLLLGKGFDVRATARNPERAQFLDVFPKQKGASLEIVAMDLLDKVSVVHAVEGCEIVIHCAAALMVGVRDAQSDVVDPSVVGTTNLCEAIEGVGCVKTVIHTSSVAAIRRTRYQNGHTFSAEDWCDDATLQSNPYGLAKAEAERIMRAFVEQQPELKRPRLVTIHPSIVFGPVFQKRHTQGSMAYLKHFTGRMPFVLNTHLNYVDVRDVACAHVAALESGQNGARYILHKEGVWMQEIGRRLRVFKPGKKWAVLRLPKPAAALLAVLHPQLTWKMVRSSLGRHVAYDIGNVEQELGIELHSSEQTLVDSIESMLKLSV